MWGQETVTCVPAQGPAEDQGQFRFTFTPNASAAATASATASESMRRSKKSRKFGKMAFLCSFLPGAFWSVARSRDLWQPLCQRTFLRDEWTWRDNRIDICMSIHSSQLHLEKLLKMNQ